MPSSRSLLLVENDQSYAYLIGRLWSQVAPDVTLRVAKDGHMALDQIANLQPDLVLLDLVMPDMTGLELLRLLKSSDELTRIPVVVLTAYSHDHNAWEAYHELANAFVVKPDEEELRTMLSAIHAFWFTHVLLPLYRAPTG
ncbi:response regulator [Deinococcus peraridilitoris]|uniref:Response regulator with CheY-like receiver, AAA-type ATPase, and DNA-binding domains n=1 Tax=Deinococcus peraridilitoris (strain DSM 19664 / LMG 22246 / CIP 109416 / KR-200) TaxID=937777 RepID=L0A3R1_DEIPD|nr:response regulator [Deinococcus peraridilitoris]AFZ67630.1 response regulator with CheY-like receiver, AAA-type ATPase, and DNA-binding domains [Deinococcus peraridilitoris DSM 19664]